MRQASPRLSGRSSVRSRWRRRAPFSSNGPRKGISRRLRQSDPFRCPSRCARFSGSGLGVGIGDGRRKPYNAEIKAKITEFRQQKGSNTKKSYVPMPTYRARFERRDHMPTSIGSGRRLPPLAAWTSGRSRPSILGMLHEHARSDAVDARAIQGGGGSAIGRHHRRKARGAIRQPVR